MSFRAQQRNTFAPFARWFLIDSTMYGVPVVGLHRFVGDDATMQVRVLSLLDVVDARGPEMNQSETVTMLNDLCVLAPGALIDERIRWRILAPRKVEATFSNAGQTVAAVLSFDDEANLIDFQSDDRYQRADGKSYARYRWSTPLREYRRYGGYRLASRGDAIWDMPFGPLVYGEFELIAVEYNPSTSAPEG